MTASEMDDLIVEWLIKYNDRWVCVSDLPNIDWWSMYKNNALEKMLPSDPDYYKSERLRHYGHFRLTAETIRRIQNDGRTDN